MAKKQPASKPMNNEEFASTTKEVMTPQLSKDSVTLGNKQLKVQFLHYQDEVMLLDLVNDTISKFGDIPPETKTHEVIRKVKSEIYRLLPEAMVMIFGDQGVTQEWLQDRANRVTSDQMFEALQAQVMKNGILNRLGEFLPPGVLTEFLVKMMTSL